MPVPVPEIAIVDDEPEMRKALRRLLTGRGYRVREYTGGKELLLDARAHRPDCLLLDLHMPEVSGFEVLEALRLNHIALSVVVITAHDSPEAQSRAKSLGANAYLSKPIGSETLFPAIEAATASHSLPSRSETHPQDNKPACETTPNTH